MSEKSGILTDHESSIYEKIRTHVIQEKMFSSYIHSLPVGERSNLIDRAAALGLCLNVDTGQVSYGSDFEPFARGLSVCYVRHGQTTGNLEPRVFQGFVDYKINQLNDRGRKQAAVAAHVLEENLVHWEPDLIVCSPLQRAVETSEPFKNAHPSIPFDVMQEAAEMRFGGWDNQKVIDIPVEDFAHLFYIKYNVLVKSPHPHVVEDGWYDNRLPAGHSIEAECFLDLLERVVCLLKKIKASYPKSERVLIYGHSMAGAALMILLGHGKCFSGTNILAFDGHYIMPNATPTLLNPKSPIDASNDQVLTDFQDNQL